MEVLTLWFQTIQLLKKLETETIIPLGINNKRPDRAVLVYCNLIRQYFKNTVPIVLGGIEASLRRVTHYDYWSNKLHKPILFDSKADILIYGMGEEAICELTRSEKSIVQAEIKKGFKSGFAS